MTSPRSTRSLAVLAGSFVVLGSCGGSMPVKRHYTLVNEYAEPHGSAAPLCDRPLAVTSGAPPDAPYDLDKIAFRTDQYEVKYYNYRVWVRSPADMLVGLIARKLEKARLFESVETLVHSPGDHFTLYVRLHAIEKVEIGGRHSARLAMSFLLRSPDDEETLWVHEFDEMRNVGEEGVPPLLRTLNGIYNAKVDAMLRSIAEAISAGQVCGRPEAGRANGP